MDSTYLDKIKGGWLGKCAGGILGAPIEGYKRFNEIPLTEDLFKTNFPNDDLDLQLLWLDMLEKKGFHIDETDFAKHWMDHVNFPWNEYGVATHNLKLGLDLPQTGIQDNAYWGQSMGSPIRSEIWGMVFAGKPELAAKFATMDSSLDHSGFSVEAEAFLSACAALAFESNDIKNIFSSAKPHISGSGVMAQLLTDVSTWYDSYGFTTTSKLIKQKYGDADFTSAPMNIGFTLLSLLHAQEDFDGLFKSLHLGHDSDCIVATAGALLGIINGYENIPDNWKKWVTPEIMVSKELVGLQCPKTLDELTERTFQVAQNISEITEKPSKTTISKITARAWVSELEEKSVGENTIIQITLKNHGSKRLKVKLTIESDYFRNSEVKEYLAGNEERDFFLNVIDYRPSTKPKIPYTIILEYDNKQERFEKGLPNYGSWLMIGPFMKDDPDLEPFHETYPDHGLDSLPSATYMNHDSDPTKHSFLDVATINKLIKEDAFAEKGYLVNTINPSSFSMDLGEHFYGKGERSIYLVADIDSAKNQKKWLCMGASGFITTWLNDSLCYQNKELRRRWPYAHAAELHLKKGKNRLVLRLDFLLDDFTFEIGIKNHDNRHYHQTQWDTSLLFTNPSHVISQVNEGLKSAIDTNV